MNRTTWIIVGALCILGLAGLVVFTKKDSVDVASIDPAKVISATDTALGDQTSGNAKAKVVVFEYADFQCPGCGGAHRNLPKIQELYKDKILFVFRNFPLTTIHPNALAAATFAEAAAFQGKYWEMNDILYNNQTSWSGISSDKRTETFVSYATQIGLDADKLQKDLSDKKIQAKINRDRALASKLGVNSTPTLYIGNTQVDGTVVEDLIQKDGTLFMDAIDKALKAAGETPPVR